MNNNIFNLIYESYNITNLNDLINKIKNPKDLFEWMYNTFNYELKNNIVQSIDNMIINKKSMCWENCNLIGYIFEKLKINYNIISVFECTTLASHSTIIFEQNKKWYIFELYKNKFFLNGNNGIIGPFNSKNEIINICINNLKKLYLEYSENVLIKLGHYENFNKNLSFDEFMNKMNNWKIIYNDCIDKNIKFSYDM